MAKWAMVIDLDKCVACQGCSIACRFENNGPVVKPSEAIKGRAIRWNDVFPVPVNEAEASGEYPNVKTKYFTRPVCIVRTRPALRFARFRQLTRMKKGWCGRIMRVALAVVSAR